MSGLANDKVVLRLAELICYGQPEAIELVKRGIEDGIRIGLRRALEHIHDSPATVRQILEYEIERGLYASVPLDVRP